MDRLKIDGSLNNSPQASPAEQLVSHHTGPGCSVGRSHPALLAAAPRGPLAAGADRACAKTSPAGPALPIAYAVTGSSGVLNIMAQR